VAYNGAYNSCSVVRSGKKKVVRIYVSVFQQPALFAAKTVPINFSLRCFEIKYAALSKILTDFQNKPAE